MNASEVTINSRGRPLTERVNTQNTPLFSLSLSFKKILLLRLLMNGRKSERCPAVSE